MPGAVAGIGLQNFRAPFLSRPFQRTSIQTRLDGARGFLGPVGYPVGGLRISTGLQPLSQQVQSDSNRSTGEEPMDTTTSISQGENNTSQQLSRSSQPQSLNLGQALSEFMTLASQCMIYFIFVFLHDFCYRFVF